MSYYDLKQIIPCPYCNNAAVLETRAETFKGKMYIHIFYKCIMCLEEFTTTESDSVTLAPFFSGKKRKQLILEIIKTIKYKTNNNG